MQHSVLDRIYISFLVILIISFGFLIIFISVFTRRSLINEKQDTISNEARLIAEQAVRSYAAGEMNVAQLSALFDFYAQTLNSDIWYVDESGKVIATAGYFSNKDNGKQVDDNTITTEKDIPTSIYTLDPGYDIHTSYHRVGDFYGVFNRSVISINTPITFEGYRGEKKDIIQIPSGALITHSSTLDINEMMRSIYSISFIPCLVIIIIAFTFLGIISRKIIRPIKMLTDVAEDYSKGNFDVETGIESDDEIGQLAKSMEYMASELSKLEEYRHEFISNISHDFRSPLTSIRGYVTAMQDGTIPPEKQDRYLGIVLDETNRLTKLTQGLLDLNRLEIYGPYLNLTEFDFIDIVRTTLNTFEIKCIDKNIAIYLNNHAEATVVNADKTKIQQVVYNLLDNAIKFTPEGKRIFIDIKEKGEKLEVVVKDEGIGMNEDTQKKIWTRFYKDDTSRGKDKAGTGLGLAITREIIKAHNESIEVYSKEGEGSKFVFTLTKVKSEGTHSGETEILVNPTKF